MKQANLKQRFSGGLAERSKAAVLKTVDLNGSAGSNPVSSAIFLLVAEMWESGLIQHLAKVSYGFPYREFKSHRLRHFF